MNEISFRGQQHTLGDIRNHLKGPRQNSDLGPYEQDYRPTIERFERSVQKQSFGDDQLRLQQWVQNGQEDREFLSQATPALSLTGAMLSAASFMGHLGHHGALAAMGAGAASLILAGVYQMQQRETKEDAALLKEWGRALQAEDLGRPQPSEETGPRSEISRGSLPLKTLKNEMRHFVARNQDSPVPYSGLVHRRASQALEVVTNLEQSQGLKNVSDAVRFLHQAPDQEMVGSQNVAGIRSHAIEELSSWSAYLHDQVQTK